MLGKYIRNLCYEHTRYRKKPKTGDRILKNTLNVFDFNAWYTHFDRHEVELIKTIN